MNSFFVARHDPWMGPAWSPAYEIDENDDHFLIGVEMPGVPKDQIKIEYADNRVTISGQRRRRGEDRESEEFARTFALPTGTNPDKVEAAYQDGVLQLYIPKPESARPRQIKIANVESSGFFRKFLGQPSKEAKAADMT